MKRDTNNTRSIPFTKLPFPRFVRIGLCHLGFHTQVKPFDLRNPLEWKCLICGYERRINYDGVPIGGIDEPIEYRIIEDDE